jgi:hypothetical protein
MTLTASGITASSRPGQKSATAARLDRDPHPSAERGAGDWEAAVFPRSSSRSGRRKLAPQGGHVRRSRRITVAPAAQPARPRRGPDRARRSPGSGAALSGCRGVLPRHRCSAGTLPKEKNAATRSITEGVSTRREIGGIRHRHHGPESQEIRAESASPTEPLRCTSRLARNARPRAREVEQFRHSRPNPGWSSCFQPAGTGHFRRRNAGPATKSDGPNSRLAS